ncbi:protein-arginine deiminase family protein [Aquimarina longa]|uniref:protein-arginine deiminase family protein n=1 Tax=Aquimarina longa TaxID=1080221 RepID=UPI0007806C9B|nr:protein-arginine deiminase family protein [Aquimarina longa]
MPDFSIHADYDKDGRISFSTREYQSRNTGTGAVVIPNIDVESRRLPNRVSNGAAPVLDWKNRSLVRGENEVSNIIIKKSAGTRFPANCNLVLKVVGKSRKKVRLYSSRGQRIIPMVGFSETLFSVPNFTNQITFKIQVHTLTGSPSTNTVSTTLTNDQLLRLELLCVVGANVQVADTSLLSVSPLIFMDNNAVVERLYICEIPEIQNIDQGNTPAIRDITNAFRSIRGVRLVKVPISTSLGDSWLQDQFQVGYCHKPRSIERVVLHLPRMRSNVVVVNNTPNLSTFVTEHFPSTNLGLFQEFWERNVANYVDANGRSQSLSFSQSYEVMSLLVKFWNLWSKLIRLDFDILHPPSDNTMLLSGIMNTIRENLKEILKNENLSEAREQLERYYTAIRDELNSRGADDINYSDDQRSFYTGLSADLTVRYNQVRDIVVLQHPNQISITTQRMGVITLSTEEANRLDAKIYALHDSTNYGGNLEVTPPIAGAPLGKIVLGSADRMDSELFGFLMSQGKQPILNINTSWLDVAHVDELVTFVSDPRSNGAKHAAFYASPKIAMDILTKAYTLYIQGLPNGHPHEIGRPLTIGTMRRMDAGNHPVTRLFRGKYWWHHHPEGALNPIEPPKLYLRMVEYFSYFVRYQSGEGRDRYYPAALNAHELLYFGSITNEWIADNFITNLVEQLSLETPDVELIPIPVLFDRVVQRENPDTEEVEPNFDDDSTTAFTPDMINMQIINGHLLIPKPHGPRMKTADAITVLRQVMDTKYHGKLNRRYFVSRRLHKTEVWMKSPLNPGTTQSELRQIAKQFRDGFPDNTLDEIQDLIFNANRRDFDRNDNLRSGWRKLTIPENTIGLFEAYTQIVAESLHLTVHWVDSWFYHVRLGGIHCGTNVIRRPQVRRSTYWWRVHT